MDGIDLAVDPTYVDVADLNQDGRVDIIAVTASENGASATFVQGPNGGFTGYDHGQALLPATTDGAIAVGDVDSDGRQDLVVVDSERTQLLLGNGNGQFIPSPVPLASLGMVFAVSSVTELAMVDRPHFIRWGCGSLLFWRWRYSL